jgi:hypothetical protein
MQKMLEGRKTIVVFKYYDNNNSNKKTMIAGRMENDNI